MLHGVTRFYRVLHGVTGCYVGLHVVTRCYLVFYGVTRCFMVLHGDSKKLVKAKWFMCLNYRVGHGKLSNSLKLC